jgi:hypothetical protein
VAKQVAAVAPDINDRVALGTAGGDLPNRHEQLEPVEVDAVAIAIFRGPDEIDFNDGTFADSHQILCSLRKIHGTFVHKSSIVPSELAPDIGDELSVHARASGRYFGLRGETQQSREK